MPHASIGTDIIVGFPGETDDDFAVLESYLAESPLTHVHVFPYSDRPGTAAAAMHRQGARLDRARARERRAGDRPRAESAVSPRAGWNGSARSDDRGWIARRDRQLSEGENSAGLSRNEWVSVRSRQCMAGSLRGRRRLYPLLNVITTAAPPPSGRRISPSLPQSADRTRRGCRGRGSFDRHRQARVCENASQTCRRARPKGARM